MKNLIRLALISLLFSTINLAFAQDSSGMRKISFIPSQGMPSDVYTNSEVAYLCSRSASVLIADLTHPERPVIASNFPLGASWATHCNVGYVVCMVANGGAGIKALDMSDFYNPVQISQFGVTGFSSDLVYYPPYVYVANYQRGLVIVNYANLGAARVTGTCATSGEAYSVVVRNNLAYVSAGGGGLDIIDVQYPVAPRLIGHFATGGHAYKSALYSTPIHTFCYVASGSSGVKVVIVTDPSNPRLVYTIPNRGLANHVEVLNGNLFVSYYQGGIAVYSLDNPSNPTLIKWYRNGGSVHAVTAWRHYAMESNTDGYYNIFDLNPVGSMGIEEDPIPQTISLSAYPNPFNANTTITYFVPKSGPVEMNLYDAAGRQVQRLESQSLAPGTYQRSLSSTGLPSGSYFCRINAGDAVQTKRLTIVK